MKLSQLFVKKLNPAQNLYEAIVAAARQPKFYQDWLVPDNVDGRFDMIVLHVFLVLDRLKDDTTNMRQELTNAFFNDMDRSLREMGVGDLSVGKKVRKMAEAFHGRVRAYVLAKEQGNLVEALQRNVYAADEKADARELATWMGKAQNILAATATQDILIAKLNFS